MKMDQHRTLYFTDILNHTEKLNPPSTCSELLNKHPSTKSGNYYTNPQGLSSSPSAQVYCDMTSKNGVGVTVIGHDSESRTFVSGYDDRGSYKRKINYDIPMEQIVAIVKHSGNCEQFIKYECYASRFFLDGGFGWWVSRQGSRMNYWGGAAVDSGKCACAMTNSCAGGKNCNCDVNDRAWREDSGYLRDKNTLPVSELRLGDADGKFQGSDCESGYHTLGKLRCWG